MNNIVDLLEEDAHFIKYNFVNPRLCLCGEHEAAAAAEIVRLRAQRDAWKSEAENMYGHLNSVLHADKANWPAAGALDTYAAGKYPALAVPNAPGNKPPILGRLINE